MSNNYRVELKNMQFWGRHGHFQEERERGQKFFVDVEIAYDMLQMCKTDQLEQGVSYLEIYNLCREVMENEQHKLLQKLGYRIIEDAFGRFNKLEWIRVSVKKPFVPVEGIVDYISVVVEKSATEFHQDNA